MGQTNRRTSAWPALAVVLAVSFSALQPAAAGLGVSVFQSDLAKPRLGRVPVGEIFGVDGWSF